MDTPTTNNCEEQDFLSFIVDLNQESIQAQGNKEFLSQLAQFNSNYSVAQMQASLQQLGTTLQSKQALQASALVGRNVLVNSEAFQLGIKNEVSLAVDIPPDHSKISAFIYDENDELIKNIFLGNPKIGIFQFNWNGSEKVNREGKFKIKVYAVFKQKQVLLNPLIFANIDSVSVGHNGEGLKLNVAGIGFVGLDQVKQISI